jgi:hypothetical protein
MFSDSWRAKKQLSVTSHIKPPSVTYSAAAPFREQGEINTDTIEYILTADEFEKAIGLNSTAFVA